MAVCTRVSIDPITRLEGHGKIEVFLNEEGNVEQAYLQIPELRGFEKFCEGRPAEEMARITPRICRSLSRIPPYGIYKSIRCPVASRPAPSSQKLRELFYCAHIIHSHTAHFYALAGPDFVVGPGAPKKRGTF